MNIYEQFFKKAEESINIVITSHQSPDGDSVGSSVAMFHLCEQLTDNDKRKITIFFPDKVPCNLLPLLDSTNYIIGEEEIDLAKSILSKADLILCLDYNSHKRVGEYFSEILLKSNAYKVMIDHHLQPDDFSDILISDIKASSTCQLLYEVCENAYRLSLINSKVAKAIYLGLITDTGSFRFNSVNPKTLAIASELLKKNIEHDKIYEEIIDFNTIDKLKMQSYVILNNLHFLPELNLSYLYINKSEKNQFNVSKGDTEGLVNIALSIKDVKIAAFFMEDNDFIKISFRSKGKKNPVNELAKIHFNGGGHSNAAGGKFNGNLKECISYFLKIIPKYV